ERRLVSKIDTGILVYACIGYFVKTLDQSNIQNAYVSGMQNDLSMFGNQLNNAVLLFNIPYCILAIPSNILITKVRPSLYLPILELGWAALTIAKGFVKDYNQLYWLSFFLGAFEAGYSTWYTREEFSKRLTLFAVTSSLGSMFSGYLQAAVLGLDGRGGYSGWRWLFILDGIISFASAMIGFFFIPDFPRTTSWKWFTPEERELAVQRLERQGRANKAVLSWKSIPRVLGRWHFWAFVPLYAIYNSASTAWGNLIYLLKDQGYPLWQRNVYPTGVSAITAVSYLVAGWYADAFHDRFSVIFFPMIVSFVFVTILAVWDVPFSLKFASYYLAAVSSPISSVMAYLTEVIDADLVERSLVIAFMNSGSYTVFIIGQIVLWPQTSAPRFPVGNWYTAVTLFIGLFVTVAIRYLHQRDVKRGIVYLPEGIKKRSEYEAEHAASEEEKVKEDPLKDDEPSKESA
ncbi:hypothetical protein HK405_004756, partial [Cladochytrium tenue]